MTDIFGWKLSKEMSEMMTKLKMPDFVVLVSYQVRKLSVSQSVVISREQFKTKI